MESEAQLVQLRCQPVADKGQVWREIYRVFRPGGRAFVSDLAWIEDTLDIVRAAECVDATFRDKLFNMDAISDCDDVLYRTACDYVSRVDFAGYKKV